MGRERPVSTIKRNNLNVVTNYIAQSTPRIIENNRS